MADAHHAKSTIMAYREEVGKTIVAYREEVGEIIQAIPPQIFARLVDLTPNARHAVLSVICNGHTFIAVRSAASGRQRSSSSDLNYPNAKQIDEREAIRQLDELHELLSGRLQAGVAGRERACEA
jgi:hypothetical protein